MTIHHATLKKAHAGGIALVEMGGGEVKASWGDTELIATDAKSALKLAQQLKPFLIEYPWFTFGQVEDEFIITCGEDTYNNEDLGEAIGEALEAHPEPPEGTELPEEEAEEGGSIVPQRYRNEYKARGDETRCGDWLCETIDPIVTNIVNNKKGTPTKRRAVSLERLFILCRANGLVKDWPGLNNGQRAMNARNMLRSSVVKAGQIRIPGELTDGTVRLIQADPHWLTMKRAGAKVKAAA